MKPENKPFLEINTNTRDSVEDRMDISKNTVQYTREPFEYEKEIKIAEFKSPEKALADFQSYNYKFDSDQRRFIVHQLTRYAEAHPEMDAMTFLDSIPGISDKAMVYVEGLSLLVELYGKESLGVFARESGNPKRISALYDMKNDYSFPVRILDAEPYSPVIYTISDSLAVLFKKHELSSQEVDRIQGIQYGLLKWLDNECEQETSLEASLSGESIEDETEEYDYLSEVSFVEELEFRGYLGDNEKVALMKCVLDNIAIVGAPENSIDLILELNDKFGVLLYEHVAGACSKINLSLSTNKLFENLNSHDRFIRHHATKTLMMLELGRIGVSEQGLKYLNKTFDLKESNEESYKAERITRSGDVGLFNNKNVLVKYFNMISGLKSKDEVVSPEVLAVSYHLLFEENPDATDEDIKAKNEVMEIFRTKYFEFQKHPIFSQPECSGVRFNNLNFKEQGWLINFMANSGSEDMRNLKFFSEKFGMVGLRSFLVTEFDPSASKKIIELSQKIDERSMRLVLAIYSEIVDSASGVAEYLIKNVKSKGDLDRDTVNRIKVNLLKRGADIVKSASAEKNVSIEKLIQLLEEASSEVYILASVMASFKKEKREFSLEDFESIKIETKSGSEISGNDKDSMLQIANDNWASHENFRPFIIKGMEKAMTSEVNEFHIVKDGNEILAFCRFDPMPNGHIYAGSLNVRTSVRGSDIGRLVQERVLKEKTKKFVVEAEAFPGDKIFSKYIGEFGFVANGFKKGYEGSDQVLWGMEIDQNANKEYKYFNVKDEEIKKSWQGNEYKHGQDFITLKLDLKRGVGHVMEEADKILGKGEYVMTAHRPGKEEVYVVFEKRKQKN